jgi:hypothetical protein
LRWRCFLDPVSSNRKVAIGVAGLPCVTCQIDLASDRRTLESRNSKKLNNSFQGMSLRSILPLAL